MAGRGAQNKRTCVTGPKIVDRRQHGNRICDETQHRTAKDQRATLAETLRTSENAQTEIRCLRSQNHRSTRCKTMKTEDAMKHNIEQKNEQRATLAETLRSSENAQTEIRCLRSQNHRSTSCKPMKTEDMMRRKIEQQNREQRWHRRSEQANLHTPEIDICAAKIN